MLDLRSLRYVVTLSHRLSFVRAAEELNISQPALTRTVQAVEQRFGMRLFDRDRSGVRITAQGQAMLNAASVLLNNAADLEYQWERTANGQSGLVRFGIAPMPARALLSATMLERLVTVPGVINNVLVRSVDALLPLLIAGEIEFFIAAEGQVADGIPVRAEVLGRFPRSLIVRPNHPLLNGADKGIRYPILVSGGALAARSAELEEPTEGPRHVIEDFSTLVRLTASTDAIWHSSSFAVADEIAQGLLCELPRPEGMEPLEFRMILYSLERRTQSVSAISFAQLFRSQITTLRSEARVQNQMT